MAEHSGTFRQLIGSRAFLELPGAAQALYFHMAQRAGEDGYLADGGAVLALCGAERKDLEALESGRFIIPLAHGVLVVRHTRLREYLLGQSGGGEGQGVPMPKKAAPRPVLHKRGPHGYVQLTDEAYARLNKDLGEAEAARVIAYVDELAKSTGNKNGWKDWNIVLRKASREGWGRRGMAAKAPAASPPPMFRAPAAYREKQ